jgi:hypothetical protein
MEQGGAHITVLTHFNLALLRFIFFPRLCFCFLSIICIPIVFRHSCHFRLSFIFISLDLPPPIPPQYKQQSELTGSTFSNFILSKLCSKERPATSLQSLERSPKLREGIIRSEAHKQQQTGNERQFGMRVAVARDETKRVGGY